MKPIAISPNTPARKNSITNMIAVMVLGVLFLSLIFMHVNNIISGKVQIIPGVIGLIVLSLFDMWLFLISLLLYQAPIKIYEHFFTRSLLPGYFRNKIWYNEILQINNTQDKYLRGQLEFKLRDGFCFAIRLDDRFTDDFNKIFFDQLLKIGHRVDPPLKQTLTVRR